MGMSCDLKTDQCCGCMDLRTGGLILNYIGIVGSVLGILEYFFMQSAGKELQEKSGIPEESSLVSSSMYRSASSKVFSFKERSKR